MSQPVQESHRSRPLRPGAAIGSGVAAIGLLLLLPSAAAADPDLGPVPALGDFEWWAVAAVLLAQAVAVTWSCRAPAVVLVGVSAVAFVLIPVAPGSAFTLTAVAVFIAVFLVVIAHPLRRLLAPLLTAAVLLATGQFVTAGARGASEPGAAAIGAVLQALLVIGLPLLVGSVAAARQDAHEARRLELEALRREQDALLRAAISRQRTALSRELHDIAAHHMSGIAMMAAAATRQIDTDPATAKRSVGRIREQSRAVLGDLRRLVGLLREEADAASPPATLDGVSTLVDAMRAAGAEIELHVPQQLEEPEPGPLTQLVAYRTVQESLANAATHAPGAPCVVEIGRSSDGWLTVVVRNGAPTGPDPGPSGGRGLAGMAERAEMVGAELTYGPTPQRGWEVRLRIPVGEAAATMRTPALPPEDPA